MGQYLARVVSEYETVINFRENFLSGHVLPKEEALTFLSSPLAATKSRAVFKMSRATLWTRFWILIIRSRKTEMIPALTESWVGGVATPLRFGLWVLWERTQYFQEKLLQTMTYVVCVYGKTALLYCPTPVRRAGLS